MTAREHEARLTLLVSFPLYARTGGNSYCCQIKVHFIQAVGRDTLCARVTTNLCGRLFFFSPRRKGGVYVVGRVGLRGRGVCGRSLARDGVGEGWRVMTRACRRKRGRLKQFCYIRSTECSCGTARATVLPWLNGVWYRYCWRS